MESRVRVSAEQSIAAPSRDIPLPHLLITATSSGAAQTFFTVRASTRLKIGRLSVVNATSSAATLTLHSVPSGGSIGTGTTEISALSIAGNTAVDLTSLVGGLYAAGTTLRVFAGTGSALVIHGWGEEIQ